LHDLLAQWDALLYAKTLEYQLTFLEQETDGYQSLVAGKVHEFNRLSGIVNPFNEYLGRYWDMSRSLWHDTSFDVIGKYDDLLKREDELKELADLLGRMREAEIELEEETMEKVIIKREWQTDPLMRSEIVGIQTGNRLSDLVSSEAALIGDPTTESLFLQKYADSQLLTFRYEDRKLVESKDNFMEVYQSSKLKDKGPFMICVDTSESMYGRPEQIAKVLCLGILKMAAKENRRAFLLNFSSGVQTLDLQEVGNSIDAIAKFLRMSFNGGTNISLPLYEVFRQLKTENYKDADVLIISDFILYEIEDKILQGIRSFQQNQNTQFHSLILSDEANHQIINEMNTCWLYDPKAKGIIRSMTRGLNDVIRS